VVQRRQVERDRVIWRRQDGHREDTSRGIEDRYRNELPAIPLMQ
jgi:hypothetical protein